MTGSLLANVLAVWYNTDMSKTQNTTRRTMAKLYTKGNTPREIVQAYSWSGQTYSVAEVKAELRAYGFVVR